MFDFNLSVTCWVLGLMLFSLYCSTEVIPTLSLLLYTLNLIHTEECDNGNCQSSHIQFLDESTSKDKGKAPNNAVMLSHQSTGLKEMLSRLLLPRERDQRQDL